MIYNWQATFLFLVALIVLTKVIKYFIFRFSAYKNMANYNRDLDIEKSQKEKYPPAVSISNKVGLATNLVFIIAIAPFILNMGSQVWWLYFIDVAAILLIYDFFYYLMHRFLFHGQSWLRQVHGLHHQARDPSYIDAYYVHPTETFMGVALFVATISAYSLFAGSLHWMSAAVAYLLFTQLNILNHCKSNLPDKAVFKPVNFITRKHAVHHENMQKGNFSSITMVYDYLFGTLE